MNRDGGFHWSRAGSLGIRMDEAGDRWWSGRVTSLLVRSDGRVLAGTETGGVWVADEDGRAGLALSAAWERPEIGAVAFGPDGEGHVFAGGGGLYVTDQSSALPLLDWHPITSIQARSPGGVVALGVLTTPRRLVVACGAGVLWSDIPAAAPGGWTDGYVWNAVTGLPDVFGMAIGSRDRTLRAQPAGVRDTTIVLGAAGGGIRVGDWRSGALTFTQATVNGINPSDMSATSVAACERQPSRLYAAVSGRNGRLLAVLRSDDGGDVWNVCGYTPEEFGRLDGYLGDAGQFHSAIGVHRTRPDTLAVGWLGGPAYSTDGGVTWSRPGGDVHADKHAVVFAPDGGGRVYVGCDGGVFSTDDLGGSYRSLWNRPLPTLQCYSSDGARQSWGGAGVSTQIPGIVATGTQDNGNVFAAVEPGGEEYRPLTDGDGGFCAALTAIPWVLTVLSLQASPSPIVAHHWNETERRFDVTYEPKIVTAGPGQKAGDPLRAPLCVEAVTRPRLNSHDPAMHAVATVGPNLYGLVAEPGLGGGGSSGGGPEVVWGGGTPAWRYLGSAPDNLDLWAAGSYNGDLVYAGTGNRRMFSFDRKGGRTEFGVLDLPRNAGVIHRIVQLADLSAFAVNRTAKGSILYYQAGGFAWRPVFEPGDTIWAFEVCGDQEHGAVLVAATETAVHSSYDWGATWYVASDGLPRNPRCADLRHRANNIGGRVYLSTYGWSVWAAELPDGPPPPHAEDVRLAPELRRLLSLTQRLWADGDTEGAHRNALQALETYRDLARTDADAETPEVAGDLVAFAGYLPPQPAVEAAEAGVAVYRRLAALDPAHRRALASALYQLAVRRYSAAPPGRANADADEPGREAVAIDLEALPEMTPSGKLGVAGELEYVTGYIVPGQVAIDAAAIATQVFRDAAGADASLE
ncbi:WD40/YVTN/BNR-like repeat-containing protein, partial [Microbispora corallina]